MDRMHDIEAFLAIVERGGQTAAAQQLQRSLQSINRSLVAFENSVGVELIRRSTRRSQPTEAGAALYDRLKPAFLEINDAKREIADQRAEPAGRLNIAAPVRFAATFVVPTIAEFMRRYPRVAVHLKVSDRKIDPHADDVDVAIRIRELPDSGLRARRIATLRTVVFGAPAYFREAGRPQHPAELTMHQCVLRNADPEGEKWAFRIRGQRHHFRVVGRFTVDDSASLQEAVARGLGLGLAPAWHIRDLIASGAVEIVLERFEDARRGIYAVSSATKLPLAKTRLFIDMLAARLRREKL